MGGACERYAGGAGECIVLPESGLKNPSPIGLLDVGAFSHVSKAIRV